MDASQQYYDPQSSYRPGQLRGHGGVARDAQVSDWDRGIPPFTDAYARAVFFSSYQRMPLAIIGHWQTRIG